MGDHGRDHPAYLASRLFSRVERNYSTMEREALGRIYVMQKFRYVCNALHILCGSPGVDVPSKQTRYSGAGEPMAITTSRIYIDNRGMTWEEPRHSRSTLLNPHPKESMMTSRMYIYSL